MSVITSRRAVLAGASALTLLSAKGWTQEALKIVYPFPAGNAADAVARLIADRLQRGLHRAAIVENKPGAGGRIGARAVKDAGADGSVLLFAVSSQLTLQPHLSSDVGYDPFTDFAPLSQVMAFDQAVAVPADSPVRSVSELVAWYKANPGQEILRVSGKRHRPACRRTGVRARLSTQSATCPLSGDRRGASRSFRRANSRALCGKCRADRASYRRQAQDSRDRRHATLVPPPWRSDIQGKRRRYRGDRMVRALRPGTDTRGGRQEVSRRRSWRSCTIRRSARGFRRWVFGRPGRRPKNCGKSSAPSSTIGPASSRHRALKRANRLRIRGRGWFHDRQATSCRNCRRRHWRSRRRQRSASAWNQRACL